MVASVTQLSEGPGVYRNVVGEHNWSLSPTLRMHQKCFGLRFAPIFHLAAIEDSTAGSGQRERGANRRHGSNSPFQFLFVDN